MSFLQVSLVQVAALIGHSGPQFALERAFKGCPGFIAAWQDCVSQGTLHSVSHERFEFPLAESHKNVADTTPSHKRIRYHWCLARAFLGVFLDDTVNLHIDENEFATADNPVHLIDSVFRRVALMTKSPVYGATFGQALVHYEQAYQLLKTEEGSLNSQDHLGARKRKLLEEYLRALRILNPEKGTRLVSELSFGDMNDGQTEWRGRIEYQAGCIFLKLGNLNEADSFLQKSLDRAQKANSKILAAMILAERGGVFEQRGRYDDAIDVLLQGIEMAESETADLEMLKTDYYHRLACIYFRQNALDDAYGLFSQVKDMAIQVGDVDSELKAKANMGSIHLQKQEYDVANRFFTETLARVRTSGDEIGEARALMNLGRAQLAQGAVDAARTQFESARVIAWKTGWSDGIASAVFLLNDMKKRDKGEDTSQNSTSMRLDKLQKRIGKLTTGTEQIKPE
jgi:tetratricopeptide (TPR) repeat protein